MPNQHLRPMRSLTWAGGGLSLLLLTGCLATLVPADFDDFYDPVAAERYPERNGSFFRWDIRFGWAAPLGGDNQRRLAFSLDVFNLTDAGNYFSSTVAPGNAILGSPNFKQLDQTPGPINMQISVQPRITPSMYA